MTPQIVVVVLGGILILAGLLGGGFELKELKMPRVGGVARVLSLVAGIVLLGLGLKMTPQNTSDATPPHTEAPPPHKDVTPARRRDAAARQAANGRIGIPSQSPR